MGGLNWVSTRLYPLVKAACPTTRCSARPAARCSTTCSTCARLLALAGRSARRTTPRAERISRLSPRPGSALRPMSSSSSNRRPMPSAGCTRGSTAAGRERSMKRRQFRRSTAFPVVTGWQLTPEGGGDPSWRASRRDRRRPPRLRVGPGCGGRQRAGSFSGRDARQARTACCAAAIDRLVVAGDLVESPRPCSRTAAELARLALLAGQAGRAAGADRGESRPRPCLDGQEQRAATPWLLAPVLQGRLVVAGWTIAHGHRPCRRIA